MVSDIGGALGLVLGLSILDLLVFASNFMRTGVSGLVTLKKELDNKKVSYFIVSRLFVVLIQKDAKNKSKIPVYKPDQKRIRSKIRNRESNQIEKSRFDNMNSFDTNSNTSITMLSPILTEPNKRRELCRDLYRKMLSSPDQPEYYPWTNSP